MGASRKIDNNTPKERLFCYAYFNNGGNGTQAAIEAGYAVKSARVTASQLLTKPNIKALLEKLNIKLEEKTVITKERIAAELAKTGFFDIRTVYDKNGSLLSISELPAEAGSAIAGVKVLDVFEGYGEDRSKIGETVEVKLNGKIPALAELNKMFGYYAPAKLANTDSEGNDLIKPDMTKLTDAEVLTLIKLQQKICGE